MFINKYINTIERYKKIQSIYKEVSQKQKSIYKEKKKKKIYPTTKEELSKKLALKKSKKNIKRIEIIEFTFRPCLSSTKNHKQNQRQFEKWACLKPFLVFKHCNTCFYNIF